MPRSLVQVSVVQWLLSAVCTIRTKSKTSFAIVGWQDAEETDSLWNKYRCNNSNSNVWRKPMSYNSGQHEYTGNFTFGQCVTPWPVSNWPICKHVDNIVHVLLYVKVLSTNLLGNRSPFNINNPVIIQYAILIRH